MLGVTLSVGGAVTVIVTGRRTVTKGDPFPLNCTVTVAITFPGDCDEGGLAVRSKLLPLMLEAMSQG
jgi:hypothetical protein